jgi:hypothetical protein
MVAVERTSRYANLSCAICHQQFKPGDLVLPSIRGGQRRAIHAHVCRSTRTDSHSQSARVPVHAVA